MKYRIDKLMIDIYVSSSTRGTWIEIRCTTFVKVLGLVVVLHTGDVD